MDIYRRSGAGHNWGRRTRCCAAAGEHRRAISSQLERNQSSRRRVSPLFLLSLFLSLSNVHFVPIRLNLYMTTSLQVPIDTCSSCTITALHMSQYHRHSTVHPQSCSRNSSGSCVEKTVHFSVASIMMFVLLLHTKELITAICVI